MSFHVPEKFRLTGGQLGSTRLDGNNGAFALPALIPGRNIRAIASDGGGWEHVSVSIEGRRSAIPNWEEMCKVKSLFWDEDDVVVQFHPRKTDYVNNHPGCLHLWRPVGVTLPTPPPEMVGVKSMGPEEMRKHVEAGKAKPFSDDATQDAILKESERRLDEFRQAQKS